MQNCYTKFKIIHFYEVFQVFWENLLNLGTFFRVVGGLYIRVFTMNAHRLKENYQQVTIFNNFVLKQLDTIYN